uniref:Protein farnesyltransferase subunit beta n=1 Tax=Meloidogyne javanica TaxID=6303 RepID=A0A915LP28_MELJA
MEDDEDTNSFLGHPDDFITQTSIEQIKLENIIKSIRATTTKDDLNNFKLHRQQHINFILGLLNNLPGGYSELSSSRAWLCFWGVHSLRLLGGHLKEELANRIVSVLNLCKSSGGYAGAPGHCPHIVTTYAAVMTLVEIGTDEALNSIERDKLKEFISSMKQSNGSFCVHEDGEIDVRAVYCAFTVSYLCNLSNLEELFEGSSAWLTRCQTYEGGFGGEPGCESHGGYTFCALATFALMQKMYLIDTQSALRWLVFRQMKLEGGFQGRTNKLVDVCYSYWLSACFCAIENEIFNKGNSTEEDKCLFNVIDLQKYILEISQNNCGGFRDKPEKSAKNMFWNDKDFNPTQQYPSQLLISPSSSSLRHRQTYSNLIPNQPLTKQVDQLLYEIPDFKFTKNSLFQPPEFLKVFSDIRCIEGSTAIFDCMILGSPRPKVCWLFNDEKLTFDDVILEDTSGNN